MTATRLQVPRPSSAVCLHRTPVAAAVALALAGTAPFAHATAPLPGAALGDPFPINTYTVGAQSTPAVAVDASGDFVVVWESKDQVAYGSGYDIFAQRYHADGTANGGEFPVNTTTTGDQVMPAVAMDADGDFVVTWTDRSGADDDGYGVFARRFNADGIPDGGEFPVNSTTSGYQVSPAVAMDAAGDMVIAWASDDGGYYGYNVFTRHYTLEGDGTLTAGAEIQANTTNPVYSDQQAPAVAMDAAGDYVVAWESQEGDGDDFAVVARYFAVGNAAGDEILVNTTTSGAQRWPSVAMEAGGGGFVVAWTSGASESVYDIYARRYAVDGTGTPVAGAGDFRVNTTVSKAQESQSVAMDAAGDFVVDWQSYQDGTRKVIAQRYDSNADPVGGEIQVSVGGGMVGPAAAMDPAGDLVVAWWNWLGADGSSYGVFARRYARTASLDLKGTLASAPAGTVKPGASLTLTAGISNTETPATLTGNAIIDKALATATGLTATLTFPDDVTFDGASGTNWDCPTSLTAHELTCTYGAGLPAATPAEALTVNVTAPDTNGVKYTFSNAVFGAQPDANAGNDTASVDVTASNAAPVAASAGLMTGEGVPATGQLSATDADGDDLTYALVSAPGHGKVVIDADGGFVYAPVAGYSGADSFTFTASDGALDSNVATVSITVKPAVDDDTGGDGAGDDKGKGGSDGSDSGNDGTGGGNGGNPAPPVRHTSGGGGGASWLGLGLLGLAGLRRRKGVVPRG